MQFTEIRNEMGNLLPIVRNKKIFRKYYEKLYANILNNLNEMENFEKHKNLPRLNHQETEILIDL